MEYRWEYTRLIGLHINLINEWGSATEYMPSIWEYRRTYSSNEKICGVRVSACQEVWCACADTPIVPLEFPAAHTKPYHCWHLLECTAVHTKIYYFWRPTDIKMNMAWEILIHFESSLKSSMLSDLPCLLPFSWLSSLIAWTYWYVMYLPCLTSFDSHFLSLLTIWIGLIYQEGSVTMEEALFRKTLASFTLLLHHRL